MATDYYVRRIIFVVCSFTAAGLFLAARLYSLAFGDNRALEVLSGQYTRSAVVAQHNGFVYDTHGALLSHEHDGAIAIVNPAGVLDKNRVIGYLSDNSSYSFNELLKRLEKGVPFTIKTSGVTDAAVPDGVYLYPAYKSAPNSFCRHLLGFRSSGGEGMSGVFESLSDIVDKYSGSLKYKYTADAVGEVMRDGMFYVEDMMYTGTGGVILTVDGAVQKNIDGVCDEYMEMGAVIVSELSGGNILALSSRPLYDMENVAQSLDSDKGELINRAFSLYTPGSVFKAAVAASALEKDEVLYELEYECTGVCNVSGKKFRCHEKSGHGIQTMKEAFANSCNTYFINLLNEAGFEYTLTVCGRMGLGNPYAIDGLYVNGANMPEALKKYPDAYKANFSFGQGELLLSCVDVLNIYSVCATGYRSDFSVVKGIRTDKGEQDIIFEPKAKERVLSEDTVVKMREMMRLCVKEGTGKAAEVSGTAAGGKTATAQSGQIKDGSEVLHRWFAGVFPIDEPRYAIVVLCDGNGQNNADPKEIFARCAEAVLEIYDN